MTCGPFVRACSRALGFLGVFGVLVGEPAAGQAALKGLVTIDSSAVPVPGALVQIQPGDFTAQSGARGEFLLAGLPGGRLTVTVRAVGYRELAIGLDFVANDTLDLVFELSRDAQRLETVEVSGERLPASGKIVEFERRRALGFGSFFSRAELQEYDAYQLSDALRTLSNITLVPRKQQCGGGYAASSGRGGSRGNDCMYGPGCFLGVFVNGVRIYDPSMSEPPNIDEYLTARVEAIELYRGAGQLPTEFQGTGTACGALVIWTRVGGER